MVDPQQTHSHPHEHPHASRWRSRIAHTLRPHSHDSVDAADAALESSAQGIRALKLSLVILMATALVQLVVVLVSGSVALLADTIHNFSDALTAVPLWIAFVLTRRAPSKRFTYGLGRAEDLAGLFIVLMIALSAAVAGYESVRRIVEPQTITHVWVVLAAGLVGFVGNEWVAVYRIRVGRRIGSAALVADGQHARTDGFTSLGVAAGALGVLAGFPVADPIVGLLITAAIVVVLRQTAVDIIQRLLDGVDPELVVQAEAALLATPQVEQVHAVQLRWIGRRLHAEAGIGAAATLSLTDAHALAHRAEDALRRDVPRLSEATVHVGPPTGAAA